MSRTCGNCTKCCEGHLYAVVNGHELVPNNPCPILQIGKGCGDYENRPEDPCRSFYCQWITNPDIPEDLYPANSGVIITVQKIDDIMFMKLTCAPNEPTADQLTWFIMYGLRKKINIAWDTLKKKYWMGDTLFTRAMNREFLDEQ